MGVEACKAKLDIWGEDGVTGHGSPYRMHLTYCGFRKGRSPTGIANVNAGWGVVIGWLEPTYGCTDLSSCPDTTKVKYVQYADGAETSGAPLLVGGSSVPVKPVARYLVRADSSSLDNCTTAVPSSDADCDEAAGTLP